MGTCPDKECQARKVNWRTLTVAGTIIIVLGGGGYAIDRASCQEERRKNGEAIAEVVEKTGECSIKIAEFGRDIENIREDISELKQGQKEILREIRRGNNRADRGTTSRAPGE